MNRRRFLTFTAALTTAAGLPLWSACRLSGDDDEPGEISSLDPVGSALKRARALGKPLLVLVVPEDEGEQAERGRLLGTLINHGDGEVLRDLALCEVLCARSSEVADRVDDVDETDEPWMFLIETDDVRWRARAIEGELPEYVHEDWSTEESEEEASARARLDALAALLHDAIAPDRHTLERRAQHSIGALTADELSELRSRARAGDFEPELADRHAAWLLLEAREGRGRENEVAELLGAAAIARLRAVPPYGAKWARSMGCGTTIEGEDHSGRMVACGMGHVPELSVRFLSFYV